MEMPQWVTSWKAILGSIAAVLVVALQIIQLLLSTDIEHRLDTKTSSLDAKTVVLQHTADTLTEAFAAHGQITQGNRALLIELHNELHALEEAKAAAARTTIKK